MPSNYLRASTIPTAIILLKSSAPTRSSHDHEKNTGRHGQTWADVCWYIISLQILNLLSDLDSSHSNQGCLVHCCCLTRRHWAWLSVIILAFNNWRTRDSLVFLYYIIGAIHWKAFNKHSFTAFLLVELTFKIKYLLSIYIKNMSYDSHSPLSVKGSCIFMLLFFF